MPVAVIAYPEVTPVSRVFVTNLGRYADAIYCDSPALLAAFGQGPEGRVPLRPVSDLPPGDELSCLGLEFALRKSDFNIRDWATGHSSGHSYGA